MRYEDTTLSSPEIGEELEVDYLLEGTVRREGCEVRITAQLIHAATDGHLWANAYDRDITDVFAVQSEIARTIAAALEQRLLPGEGAEAALDGTLDPTDYDLLLRGREYLNRPGEDDVRKYPLAMEFFHRAIEANPRFAHAYAGMSQAFRRHVGLPLVRIRRDSTLHYARQAVKLTPDLPEGVTELGFGHLFAGDHAPAEAAFERALALDPDRADAMDGMAPIAAMRGRLDEAVRWQRRAASVDPFSGPSRSAPSRSEARARTPSTRRRGVCREGNGSGGEAAAGHSVRAFGRPGGAPACRPAGPCAWCAVSGGRKSDVFQG